MSGPYPSPFAVPVVSNSMQDDEKLLAAAPGVSSDEDNYYSKLFSLKTPCGQPVFKPKMDVVGMPVAVNPKPRLDTKEQGPLNNNAALLPRAGPAWTQFRDPPTGTVSVNGAQYTTTLDRARGVVTLKPKRMTNARRIELIEEKLQREAKAEQDAAAQAAIKLAEESKPTKVATGMADDSDDDDDGKRDPTRPPKSIYRMTKLEMRVAAAAPHVRPNEPQPEELLAAFDRMSVNEKHRCGVCGVLYDGYYRKRDICEAKDCTYSLCPDCRQSVRVYIPGRRDFSVVELRLTMRICTTCNQFRFPKQPLGCGCQCTGAPTTVVHCLKCSACRMMLQSPIASSPTQSAAVFKYRRSNWSRRSQWTLPLYEQLLLHAIIDGSLKRLSDVARLVQIYVLDYDLSLLLR
jgi:hypothetical protein